MRSQPRCSARRARSSSAASRVCLQHPCCGTQPTLHPPPVKLWSASAAPMAARSGGCARSGRSAKAPRTATTCFGSSICRTCATGAQGCTEAPGASSRAWCGPGKLPHECVASRQSAPRSARPEALGRRSRLCRGRGTRASSFAFRDIRKGTVAAVSADACAGRHARLALCLCPRGRSESASDRARMRASRRVGGLRCRATGHQDNAAKLEDGKASRVRSTRAAHEAPAQTGRLASQGRRG